ncbi:alpha/beta hydrolase [Mycolicibacterium pyrenivorans]|uniref:alpha/beta hydrolase n=1 Tax=Mycolicibacterium pyrenivorans TaxID=187102 RepID=UPI0021F26E50|nr:alpha/beta hydrolase [Mycolicibacterium pyrenivorans]MCV7153640.1 alpha/beta hydrolase fold domain-containing protein [Mycolicibacterium pyrenivorans]
MSDGLAESQGRRLVDDADAEVPQLGPTAAPATTGQLPDVVTAPTKAAHRDEEPHGELDTEVIERSPNPAPASVNAASAAEPAAPVEESAGVTTASAESPSEFAGENSSVVELTIAPATVSAVETLVDIAQREGTTTPVVTTAADAAAGPDVAAPAVYTGQPSAVQRVVVFVLRAVNAVLSPFGGILAFTGLKVPILADGVPPRFVTSGLDVQRDTIAGMPVYILTPPTPQDATVVALHGGAYVAEASIFHWEMYADMARKTGATVIVPDYPLIGEPGGTADVVVPQTAEVISEVIATRGAEHTYVLGDSAGGGLALAAVQMLVASGAATPRRMALIAPWLDATVSDRAGTSFFDPLLNVSSLRRDGRLWAGGLGPAHRWASPINGALDGLPPITVYSGSLDLLSPQTLRLRERAVAEGADITFELRNGYMHAYPIFFFLPDALAERPSIYRALLDGDRTAAERIRVQR